jgi:hypothetical protein
MQNPTVTENSNDFSSLICLYNERPLPIDLFGFFQSSTSSTKRVFLTITDSPSVWQTDLIIGERIFGDMVVCPYSSTTSTLEEHTEAFEKTKLILKERMKYPGVKESPELEKIAKTWILPAKLTLGPEANSFLQQSEFSVNEALADVFSNLKMENPQIHVLKLEVKNGQERQFIYKFLDCGFRPSLLLVNWSYDLDDHIATAHCCGHLFNSGYCLVKQTDLYSLYMFQDQTLYDICSMKTVSLTNPILNSVLASVTESKTDVNASGASNESLPDSKLSPLE